MMRRSGRDIVGKNSYTFRTLEEVDKAYVTKVLKKTGGNKVKASQILGINRTSIWRMMHRLNIKE